MFSIPLLGTDKNKTKMSWVDYYFSHCWMTGWQTIGSAFRIWSDLMTSNYDVYALPRIVEDPEKECIEWFWVTLGEDNCYDKEFLEYLLQIAENVENGTVKTIPYSREMFEEDEELLKEYYEN